MADEIQTSIQFVLGGVCGASIGVILLCHLFGWHQRQAFGKAIKLFLGLFTTLVLTFVFARLFDLWMITADHPQQSLELLRVISNFAIVAAIGGGIAYLARQQAEQSRRQERPEILNRSDRSRYFARLGED